MRRPFTYILLAAMTASATCHAGEIEDYFARVKARSDKGESSWQKAPDGSMTAMGVSDEATGWHTAVAHFVCDGQKNVKLGLVVDQASTDKFDRMTPVNAKATVNEIPIPGPVVALTHDPNTVYLFQERLNSIMPDIIKGPDRGMFDKSLPDKDMRVTVPLLGGASETFYFEKPLGYDLQYLVEHCT